MGMLGNIFAKAARWHGFKVISEDERYEAQRVGADKAREIYGPIFENLVSKHKMLEKLVDDKKKDYEAKKQQLKSVYGDLKNETAVLEQKCREKNGVSLYRASIFSGSAVKIGIDSAMGAFAMGELLLLSPVSKEDVPEYKKAVEYGFNKTKDIFEKKIKSEQAKINKVIEKLFEFTKTSDRSFEEAMKLLTEQLMKKKFYEYMLAR